MKEFMNGPSMDQVEDDVVIPAENGERFGTVDDPIQAAQDMSISKATLEELQDMYRYEAATLTDESEERIVEKLRNLGMNMKEIDALRAPTN